MIPAPLEWLARGSSFRLSIPAGRRYRSSRNPGGSARDCVLHRPGSAAARRRPAYRPRVLLRPLGNAGWQNPAWAAATRGTDAICQARRHFARRGIHHDGRVLGGSSASPRVADLIGEPGMTWSYDRAETATWPSLARSISRHARTFVTALAFGTPRGKRASRAGSCSGFAAARASYVNDWTARAATRAARLV